MLYFPLNKNDVFTSFKYFPIKIDAMNDPIGLAAIIYPKTSLEIPFDNAYGGKKGVIRDPDIATNILQRVKT